MLRLQLLDTLVPVTLDEHVHPHASDLVDADQHRLAGLPCRRVMAHEVAGHLVEPLAGGDDVVVALQLPLQALRDVDVVGLQLFQLLGDALVQVVDGHAQVVAAGVVVERHRGAVLHRALEVVGGDVVAEHLARDLVAGEQRRAGEADATGVRQGVAHVEGERAVLRAVRLVADDDDVVAAGVAGLGIHVLVELLDQREDVGLVLGQQPTQVVAAARPAGVTVVVHHAAAGEGLVDLGVEIVAVGQHQEREVAAQLAMHLAGEHHHRVALAGPLGVPENAELPVSRLPLAHRLDGPVHAEELVVAGQDLPRLAGRLVEEDEVLDEVEKVALVADALQQRLHVHGTRLLLGQPLPLVEVPPPARDGADPRLLAVGEHHHRVVVEEVRDGVAVIGVVLLEGGLQIAVDVLALDEEQRQPVDEADEVRPAAVEIAAHPQLAYAEEVVVIWVVEVEHAQAPLGRPAFLVTVGDLDAVAQQAVLLAVGGDVGLGRGGRGDAPRGVVVGVRWEARVQGRQPLAERAGQHYFAV